MIKVIKSAYSIIHTKSGKCLSCKASSLAGSDYDGEVLYSVTAAQSKMIFLITSIILTIIMQASAQQWRKKLNTEIFPQEISDNKDGCEPGMFCVDFKDQNDNNNLSTNGDIVNDSTFKTPKGLSKLIIDIETVDNKTEIDKAEERENIDLFDLLPGIAEVSEESVRTLPKEISNFFLPAKKIIPVQYTRSENPR